MGPFILFFVAMATASPVRRQSTFGIMDLDGDGRLSKSEVLASMTLDQAILAVDHDGDGFFSPLQVFQLTDDAQIFHVLDADHDGRVSYDEVRAGTNMARIFDREDTNMDGYLDGPEADKIVFIFTEVFTHGLWYYSRDQIDADGDQLLSKDEVLNAITLDQVFAAADDDQDGAFSQVQMEVTFNPVTFQMLDANADGKVSFGEFRKVMDMGDVYDFNDMDGSGFLEDPEQRSIVGVYNLIQNVGAAFPADPNLDTDGDGKLSKQEVMSAMTLEQIMLANDADADGKFSEIDILSYFSRDYFARMDADGDGFVTFAEMRAVIDVGSFFDYCDADGNGFLESLEQYKVIALYYPILFYDFSNTAGTN
ncbi:uncharacterized protein LOC144924094 [Branchiostoma floridae x Branchiostoma belcheri]